MLNRTTTLIATLVTVLTVFVATSAQAGFVLVEDFNTDEGNDGSLLGDTTNTGQVWGPLYFTPGTDIAVGSAFGQGGTKGGGTSASPNAGNQVSFAAQSGIVQLSYDMMTSPTASGVPQPLFRDSVSAQNSSFMISGGKLSHEGLGQNIYGSLSNDIPLGSSVHLDVTYDLTNKTILTKYQEVGNALNSGSFNINYSPSFNPDTFAFFINSGVTSPRGIDNLTIGPVVPEPAAVTLLGLAGMGILRRRRAA
jgi:hypothetical protein